MTTIVPPEQTVADRREAARQVPISVNLLPEEIIEARAGRSARRIAIAALAATVVLVGGWYYHSRQSRDDAASQLTTSQQDAAKAAAGSGKYSGLTSTKGDISALKTQVCDVTTGTVAWSKLIGRIRSVTPSGVVLTGITANTAVAAPIAPVSTDGADASASSPPVATPTTTTPAFTATGSLTIAGTETAKTAAPAFANALERVAGLVQPYVTSVTTDPKSKTISFAIQLSTDKRALSTRYCKAGK